MKSTKNSLKRILIRTAVAAAVVTTVASAVIQASAGAAPRPPYSTSTAVSGPKSLVTGQAVVFTATVKSSPRAAPTPYGQVVFTITGGGGYTANCDSGDTVTLSGGGTAQCSVSGGAPASASPLSVSAAYTDTTDSDFNPSSGSLSQPVSKGGTTTGVTSSSNPSVSGESVTFVATVGITAPAVGTLTGSVTFVGVTCDGGNTVSVSSDMASCTISAGLDASGSPYTVTASYGEDPNFAASTSPKLKQNVDKAATTIVLSASPNDCSGDVCTISAGSAVSFTGTVTTNSPGTGTPTGSLVFSVVPAGKAKQSETCDGGDTQPLSGVPGSDTATCTFSAGLPATVYYTVTATLSDPNYAGTSATLYETSGELSTDTTMSHPNGLTAGQTFNVTAKVTGLGPPSSLPPTGYVDISVCGENDNGNNGCQGTPEPVDPSTGQAVLTVAGGEFPGEYTITAAYEGDTNYLPSTARAAKTRIGLAPTSIAVVSSENPSISGDPVSLTAEVTAADGSAGSTLVGPPTGSVTFTITDPNNNTYTCENGNTVPLDNGAYDEGIAQCYLPSGTLNDLNLPDGDTNYTVSVNYPNDGDFQSSHLDYTQEVVPPIS